MQHWRTRIVLRKFKGGLSKTTAKIKHQRSRTSPNKSVNEQKNMWLVMLCMRVLYLGTFLSRPSANRQREMSKFHVFWKTQTRTANFSHLFLELTAAVTYLSWAVFSATRLLDRFTQLRFWKVKCHARRQGVLLGGFSRWALEAKEGFGAACPRLGRGRYSLTFVENWSFGYIRVSLYFCLKTIRK